MQSAGTTGATISGNTLNTTATGTVTVRATITNGLTATSNYAQNFNITVNAAFVPVTNITGVPTTATAGTPLTLTGTVVPNNATNRTIIWNVQSARTTGATISGNTLNTTAAGTITVRATITNGLTVSSNYTQNFNITINPASTSHISVTNITNVPTTANVGTPLTLTGTVVPSNATYQNIVWTIVNDGGTGVMLIGNDYFFTAAGTALFKATITNGLAIGQDYEQDFYISVGTTGIDDILAKSISIFPNPVKEELFITSENTIEKVEIYTLTGNLVIMENNFIEKISTKNFTEGIYFVKIYTDKGVVTQKVVKN